MHKDSNGSVIYDTLDELLKQKPLFIAEYSGYYYVKLKPENDFDETMWKANKQTGKVKLIHYMDYLEIEDNAKVLNARNIR